MPSIPRLQDADVAGKRVLVRADLNVPLDGGRVADDFRIRKFLPTVEWLVERCAQVTVCSHLGRPKGPDERFRIAPVAETLHALCACDVTVLENLRFDPRETANDPSFAAELATHGDVYVNDAFGSSHRAHASIVGVPKLLPSYAGFLLQEEIDTLSRLLEDAPRPFVAVLGGAKVADKLGVVRNLLGRADRILIGGGMCFTFLKARGMEVGRSLVDTEHLEDVRTVALDERIMLPSDVVVGESPESADGELATADDMPPDRMGLDIGHVSADAFARVIAGAGSVLWNGPMGVFENPAFATGTRAVALAVARCDGYTVCGGGASLEFLEGRMLPGIAALLEAPHA